MILSQKNTERESEAEQWRVFLSQCRGGLWHLWPFPKCWWWDSKAVDWNFHSVLQSILEPFPPKWNKIA